MVTAKQGLPGLGMTFGDLPAAASVDQSILPARKPALLLSDCPSALDSLTRADVSLILIYLELEQRGLQIRFENRAIAAVEYHKQRLGVDRLVSIFSAALAEVSP